MRRRVQRKIWQVCIVSMLTLSLIAGFAGCSDAYDPTGLVRANLDYLTIGEITDEILSETGQTEKNLKAAYDEKIAAAADVFVQGIQQKAEIEMTEEMRTAVKEFIAAALKKSKYEVKPEFKEENGGYSVKVAVHPMDFPATANEWLAGEEYLAEWEKKIVSGEYVYTTDEKLTEDIYHYMMDKVAAFIEETGYLKPVEVTVRVENKDGVYTPNEADMEAVGEALFAK